MKILDCKDSTIPDTRIYAEQVKIINQCSFTTQKQFQDANEQIVRVAKGVAENTQALPLAHHGSLYSLYAKTSKGIPLQSTSAIYSTTPYRSPCATELKVKAASSNIGVIRSAYLPPSDHSFRDDTPTESWVDANQNDFIRKFKLLQIQDLQKLVAIDQDSFYADHKDDALPPKRRGPMYSIKIIKGTPKEPVRPEYDISMPPKSRSLSAIDVYRHEIIRDQMDLLPQLTEIRQHEFRSEVPSAHIAKSDFQKFFKPAPSLRPISSDVE